MSVKDNTKLLLRTLRNNLLQGRCRRKEAARRQRLLDQVNPEDRADHAPARWVSLSDRPGGWQPGAWVLGYAAARDTSSQFTILMILQKARAGAGGGVKMLLPSTIFFSPSLAAPGHLEFPGQESDLSAVVTCTAASVTLHPFHPLCQAREQTCTSAVTQVIVVGSLTQWQLHCETF